MKTGQMVGNLQWGQTERVREKDRDARAHTRTCARAHTHTHTHDEDDVEGKQIVRTLRRQLLA